jgi:hypothetical protein
MSNRPIIPPMKEQPKPLERMFTLAEVAKLLKVHPRTLRVWVNLGKGPKSLKIGPCHRFRESELRWWLHRAEGA